MAIFEWIEATAVAQYIRVALYGYPIMITLHSLGLAIMVGLSSLLCLRVLGLFSRLPTAAMQPLLRIAWIGFLVNLVSGSLLFSIDASSYVTDIVFLSKMGFVLLGALLVAVVQEKLRKLPATESDRETSPFSGTSMLCAGTAIASWTFAMIAGRLIAYL